MLSLSPDRLNDPILPFMQPCPVTLRDGESVRVALDSIRAARAGDVPHFYVVDEQQRLAGVVPAHVLLQSNVDESIGDVMTHHAVAIPDWATVLVAAEFFATQRFRSFPVVGRDGTLLGQVDTSVFTPEVVALASRSFDDLFQLLGIHASHSRSAWTSFLDRFPWLMANVAGGLLSAMLASRYERLLDAVVVLALFIPVVLALAESVSMQSLTLTLQRLHGGPPVRGFLRRLMIQELGAAALREQAGVGPKAPLTDAGLFEDKLELNENWYLMPGGIGYSYDPYEIGPYAAGQISFNLEWKDIAADLKPGSALSEFASRFTKKAPTKP